MTIGDIGSAAEVFPPGDFLMEELEARGWNQQDFAAILGRPVGMVSEILNGRRGLTAETARGIADALGTSAELWLRLEADYRASVAQPDPNVAKRAQLFEKAPVREMVKRGWIVPSDSPADLEARLLRFFGITSLGQRPALTPYAAHRSGPYSVTTPAQLAWLFRCRQLAETLDVPNFTPTRLRTAIGKLQSLTGDVEGVRYIPRVLAEAGIRFVVVQHLPQTKFDGACFWLGKSSPVIAVSGRYDRIDNLWHTVMHEVGHVKAGDGLSSQDYFAVDEDLGSRHEGDQRPASEREADRFAVESLVDQRELENFIIRVAPLYSRKRIIGFARRLRVHPGIVVGQLHWRDEIDYSHSRRMLASVRSSLTDSALSDGWGCAPPVAAVG